MLESSARLLRLLSLLQSRRDWSGPELAQRLSVDVRTVRRDVDKLRRLGYPIDATAGVAGGYRLGAGAALPPLLLDDEEAVAVAVGLRTAANGTVAGMAETSVRALAKLEQVLPVRLRQRVAAVQSVTVPMASGGPLVPAEVLTAVAAACRDEQQLRFDYRSFGDTESVRNVEPYRLVHTGRRWYLLAWDLDRDDWRTFRLDRLRPWTPPGPRFAPRELPAADLAAFMSHQVSTAVYQLRATITVQASVAEVTERVPPTVGVVEPIDSASCRLTLGASHVDTLVLHLGLLDFEFRVEDPPELAQRVRELSERLRRAA
ncbi:YafY family transcriptional regulator [Natronosporangium hydrolyticum]|uniref:YafY family transcriptional regulator n=1 Tax=Natronosporangium hydrolyticum TaxID=2811111 RepID=A0A895YMU7_9ACTN|nr:YafY family protein [Natronosporangium hydrolyticum]QSB15430.1 YafY family transcriptional regulator [Natronosporangium hydrolyticum]